MITADNTVYIEPGRTPDMDELDALQYLPSHPEIKRIDICNRLGYDISTGNPAVTSSPTPYSVAFPNTPFFPAANRHFGTPLGRLISVAEPGWFSVAAIADWIAKVHSLSARNSTAGMESTDRELYEELQQHIIILLNRTCNLSEADSKARMFQIAHLRQQRPTEFHAHIVANDKLLLFIRQCLFCEFAVPLSREGRWANATSQRFTVVQHLIACHQHADANYSSFYRSPQFRIALLLHDAAEFYTRDIPSPNKPVTGILNSWEKMIYSRLLLAFGVHSLMASHFSAIRKIDRELWQIEAVAFMPAILVKERGLNADTIPSPPQEIEHPTRTEAAAARAYYHLLFNSIPHA